jgi:hypothetical protein
MNLNGAVIGSKLSVKYELIIPVIIFNLIAGIWDLHPFFGNWSFDIVPPLDNMVVK